MPTASVLALLLSARNYPGLCSVSPLSAHFLPGRGFSHLPSSFCHPMSNCFCRRGRRQGELEDSFTSHHAEAKAHEGYLASAEEQTVPWLSPASPRGAPRGLGAEPPIAAPCPGQPSPRGSAHTSPWAASIARTQALLRGALSKPSSWRSPTAINCK